MSMICIACTSLPVYATEESVIAVSADAIRVGCSVLFSKQFHPVQVDPLSTAPLICWQHGNVTMMKNR